MKWLRRLRVELSGAGEVYLGAARLLSKKRYECARKLEKLVEIAVSDLAMKATFRIEVTGSDEEGKLVGFGFRSGRLHDLDQSWRALAPAGAHRVRRRIIEGDAGSEGQRRGGRGDRAGRRRGPAFLALWSSMRSTPGLAGARPRLSERNSKNWLAPIKYCALLTCRRLRPLQTTTS